MGLDQYAYAVYPNPDNTNINIGWKRGEDSTNARAGYVNRSANIIAVDMATREQQDKEPTLLLEGPNPDNPVIQFAYWRKHPNLQGWMEKLYRKKGGNDKFNCIPVLLTLTDLDQLETAILRKDLPKTKGFFFGDDSDDYYKNDDLSFIAKAKDYISEGMLVYYDSWW
jgi:hypothetical protein